MEEYHDLSIEEKDVTFNVPQEEYEDATIMAEGKGFSSIEDLMKNKYQKFMRKYYERKGVEKWQ